MKPLYDSRDLRCKSPFGAVASGEKTSFSLYLPKTRLDRRPRLFLFEMDHPETPCRIIPLDFARADYANNIYSCTVVIEKAGLYAYHFEVGFEGKKLHLRKGEDGVGVWEHGWDWQLTVYDPALRTPAPLREGMFYQIFPDRFYKSGTPKENVPADRVLRSDWGALPTWRPNAEGEVLNNDYFGGDLQGIIEKLPYLQSLGVTILYLNPIFEAHSNHRYNTADYFQVDPLLGTNEDFSRLCAAAKTRGISVILDGAFSHTGSDSIYFNKEGRYGEGGAYRDPDSPYRSWYNFREYPHDYESWWGFLTLPNVRETEPSYLEFICGENGVIRHWLSLGAAGFRLDVVDELPDEFIDAVNRCIKTYNPDGILLGEVWEDASNKISYGIRRRYLLGGQFDSVMNYLFMNAILSYVRNGSWRDFYGIIMQVLENYPQPVVCGLMNMLSTHDTPRALTQLAGLPMTSGGQDWQEHNHYLPVDVYNRACRLYALASVILFGLPGIPCIYYGDESGLSGYRDPFNRVCYPWNYQNKKLIAQISRLGELRRRYPIFSEATFEPMILTEEVIVFLRRAEGVSILFAVNRSESRERLTLPWEFKDVQPFFLTGEYANGILEPLSGIVLVLEGNQ